MKKLLASLVLSAAMAPGIASALNITFAPTGPTTFTNAEAREVFLDLEITGLDSVGIDLSKETAFEVLELSLTSTDNPVPNSAFEGSFTLDSVEAGNFFDSVAPAFIGFGPADPTVTLTVPAFLGPFAEVLPTPASGIIGRVRLVSAAGAPTGTWNLIASVTVLGLDEDDNEVFASAESELVSLTLTPVPEPGTYALFGLGLALLGGLARRRHA